jgi:hypothetical protein
LKWSLGKCDLLNNYSLQHFNCFTILSTPSSHTLFRHLNIFCTVKLSQSSNIYSPVWLVIPNFFGQSWRVHS